MSSTAPLKRFPFWSIHWIPFLLFRHSLSNSMLSKSLTFLIALSSSGRMPLSRQLSKWLLRMRSMPPGSDGKIPSGRLIFLMNCNQKHLGQSLSIFSDEGENLCGILFYLC